ncbi:hypothetical protein [Roseateles sp.]|uniref:hypothetical protein n=1 Tax=Roseateles sp. TaxID=1971397 RepID=UPI003BA94B80
MKSRLLILLVLLPAFAFAQHAKKRPAPEVEPEPVVEDKTPRDSNKFAVLSLLGDDVQLIYLTPARGDTAQSGEWKAKPAGDLDNTVLQVMDSAIKDSAKGREAKLYTSTTRSLFGDPASLFINGKLNLPDNLSEAVRQSGAAHLLLVIRNRQDPGLAAALPARISSMLDGPGFVVDQRPSGQIGFDGQGGLPVLAPYVSIRIALIDLRDLKLKRERSMAVARRLQVTPEMGANPWAATTAEQRMKGLEALIEIELPAAVKALIVP